MSGVTKTLVRRRQRANAKVGEVLALARKPPSKEDVARLATLLGHVERMLVQLRDIPDQQGQHDAFRTRLDGVLLLARDLDRALAVATKLQGDLTTHLASTRTDLLAFESPERDQYLRAMEFKARFEHMKPFALEHLEIGRGLSWLDSSLKTAKKAKKAVGAMGEAYDEAVRLAGEGKYEDAVKALSELGRALVKLKAARKSHETLIRKKAGKLGDKNPYKRAKLVRDLLEETQVLSVVQIRELDAEIDAALDKARGGTTTDMDGAFSDLAGIEIRTRLAIQEAEVTWSAIDQRWEKLSPKLQAVWAVTLEGTGYMGTLVADWRAARGLRDVAGAELALDALGDLLGKSPLSDLLASHARWTSSMEAKAKEVLADYTALGADDARGFLGPISQGDHRYHDWCLLLARAVKLDKLTYTGAIDLVEAAEPHLSAYTKLREDWLALAELRAAKSEAFDLHATQTTAKLVDRCRKNLQTIVRTKHPEGASRIMEGLLPHWDLPEELERVRSEFGYGVHRQATDMDIVAFTQKHLDALGAIERRARDLVGHPEKIDTLYETLIGSARRQALKRRLQPERNGLCSARYALKRVIDEASEEARETRTHTERVEHLADIDAHATTMDLLYAEIDTSDDLDDTERVIDAAIEEAQRLATEAASKTLDPEYALDSDAIKEALALRASLVGAAEGLQSKFTELQAYAKKKRAWLGGTKNRRTQLVEWCASRIDEIQSLIYALNGSLDAETMGKVRARLKELQAETRGGKARIDSLQPPDETPLRERIKRDLATLEADNAVHKYRKSALGERKSALGDLLGQIGRKPTYVLEAEFPSEHEKVLQLVADAGADADTMKRFKEEQADYEVTVSVSTYETLKEQYPAVEASYVSRRQGAVERTKREGRIGEALDDLRKLHHEVKLTLGDYANRTEAEKAAREAAARKIELKGRFLGLQKSLESMYSTLKSAHPAATALDTARGQLDQAETAGKSESWETGLEMLSAARERLEYVRKYPQGQARIALDQLGGALAVWQKTSQSYLDSLVTLKKELVELGISDFMRYAVEEVLSDLSYGIPVGGFDRDVREILTATDRRVQLAARERALATLRDAQSRLFSDVRTRLLRGAPLSTDIPFEPMARALADLERLLLMALPLTP